MDQLQWDPDRQMHYYQEVRNNFHFLVYQDGSRSFWDPQQGRWRGLLHTAPNSSDRQAGPVIQREDGNAPQAEHNTPRADHNLAEGEQNTLLRDTPDFAYAPTSPPAQNYQHYPDLPQNNGDPPQTSVQPRDTLDQSYRRRPRTFFRVGKLIMVLWSEPAGHGATESARISLNQFGERVHSEVTRFVVVHQGHESCSAVAIHTYGGRGVARRGLRKSDHAIVYSGDHVPGLSPEEHAASSESDRMTATPVKVSLSARSERLHHLSRINFGKLYTIEYNVKAKDLGEVCPEYVERELMGQFSRLFLARFSRYNSATPTAPA